MYSTSQRRLARYRAAKSRGRNLAVSTSEDKSVELAVRPSSSSSSSDSSKSRGSSSKNTRRNLKRKEIHQISTNRLKPTVPQTTTESASHEQLSPPVELRLQLLPRIAEFREKRWINAREEREYVQLLKDQPLNFEDRNDHAAVEVSKALDLVEQRHTKLPLAKNARAFRREPFQPISKASNARPSKEKAPFKACPDAPKKAEKPKARQSIVRRNPQVLSPRDLLENMDSPSSSRLEELFVEMCFFARLGYIQPPCCLRCVYQESMNDEKPDLTCRRWVAWRRDAKKQIHPKQLDGNILFVQCQAARTLTKMGKIENYTWDSKKKLLSMA